MAPAEPRRCTGGRALGRIPLLLSRGDSKRADVPHDEIERGIRPPGVSAISGTATALSSSGGRRPPFRSTYFSLSMLRAESRFKSRIGGVPHLVERAPERVPVERNAAVAPASTGAARPPIRRRSRLPCRTEAPATRSRSAAARRCPCYVRYDYRPVWGFRRYI
jgi:hypothetical protein